MTWNMLYNTFPVVYWSLSSSTIVTSFKTKMIHLFVVYKKIAVGTLTQFMLITNFHSIFFMLIFLHIFNNVLS